MYSIVKNKTYYLYVAFATYLIITNNANLFLIILMLILCLLLNSIYSYDKNLIKLINLSKEFNLNLDKELSFVKKYIKTIDIIVLLISSIFIVSILIGQLMMSFAIVTITGIIRFWIWNKIEQALISHIKDLIYTNDNILKDIL